MGGTIPNSIKIQVLTDWLMGKSRDDIAINNSISCGTVSNIIKQVKNRNLIDFELVRVLAVELRKEGHTLTDLSSSINLRNMLYMLELPEERVEKFLLALSIFNYKNDIKEPEKFIQEVEKISKYITSLDISVFDLVDDFEKKKTELKKLQSEIFYAKMDLGSLEYKLKAIKSGTKSENQENLKKCK